MFSLHNASKFQGLFMTVLKRLMTGMKLEEM